MLKSVGGAVLLPRLQGREQRRRVGRARARYAEHLDLRVQLLDLDAEVVLERHPDRFFDGQRRALARRPRARWRGAARPTPAGACPKADTGMPEANRRAPAPTTAERAIEARNCWYKRITVLSRVVESKGCRPVVKQKPPRTSGRAETAIRFAGRVAKFTQNRQCDHGNLR